MNTSAILLAEILSTGALLHAGETNPAPTGRVTPPADATLFPIPKLTSSFRERDRLLGDLSGPRQPLAEHGIQIDFNLMQFYQGVFSGGGSEGWSQRVSDSVNDGFTKLLTRGLVTVQDRDTLLGRSLTLPRARIGGATLSSVLQNRIDRLDLGTPPPTGLQDADYFGIYNLELKLDTGKMGLWPGGFIFVRMEQQFGRPINARAGTLLPPNVDTVLPSPGYEGATIPALYLTQFLSKKIAVVVGKLDTLGGDNNEFAHVDGDNRFLGTAFAFNPVVGVTAPYSPLGAALVVLPTKDLTINLSVLDTNGVATRSGFDTVFKGKTSYAGEARLATHFGGKLGHQTLGGSYARGGFAEFSQPLSAFIAGSGVTPTKSDDSWCVYWNFDQYLWNPTIASDAKGGSEVDPTRGVGLFGRIGFADEVTNPVAQFYSFGVGGKGACSSRPHDRFGVGWYYLKTSDDLPEFLHLGHEQGVEAFYTFAVTPACLITADLQVTDSAKEGIATAVIGGLRATMRF